MSSSSKFTGIHCLLLFADIEGFYELVVCGSPVSSMSIDAIFHRICSFCVSVSHFFLILTIFKPFHYY